jgi:hypothetical protein
MHHGWKKLPLDAAEIAHELFGLVASVLEGIMLKMVSLCSII